jgi:hypothetical protein
VSNEAWSGGTRGGIRLRYGHFVGASGRHARRAARVGDRRPIGVVVERVHAETRASAMATTLDAFMLPPLAETHLLRYGAVDKTTTARAYQPDDE